MHLPSKLAPFLLALAAASAAAQVMPTTFEGIDASSYSYAGLNVDPNGAVGTKQYMEWVNPVYQGFDKATGDAIYPTPMDGSTPWRYHGMQDCVDVGGNGELIFDKIAKRWVLGRRQGIEPDGNYVYCIAVSNTDDLTSPTFAWYPYMFVLNPVLGTNGTHTYYPDYPKISTWPDAYYVTIDLEDVDKGYQEVGIVACAFDRTNMIAGGTMRPPQCFRYPSTPSGLFYAHSLLPADFDGTNLPAKGAQEVFISIENPQSGSTSNKLNLWSFHVNWNNTALTTFTGPTLFTVPTYTQGCYDISLPTNTVCVPEPSTPQTSQYVDSVGDRLMQRLTFRSFTGTKPYQSYVLSQTVQVGSAPQSQTAVRWYEFRNNKSIHTGIINPGDANFRFMPSAAQDKEGNLAVGYSVSGLAEHPSISASYLNLQKGTAPTEISLWPGTADEENAFNWGTYTSMSMDPADDCTFWYVNEYFDVNQLTNPTWQTRISHFILPNCQ
jgi:hypothetical protein